METFKEIYGETVDMGKLNSKFSLVQGLFVSMILCIAAFGLYLILNPSSDRNFIRIPGKVTKSECKYYLAEKNGGRYSCNMQISYKIGDKVYLNNAISNEINEYHVGSDIDIMYNKNDPNIIKVAPHHEMLIWLIMCSLMMGGIASCVGIGWRYYMASNYNAYASVSGIGAALGYKQN